MKQKFTLLFFNFAVILCLAQTRSIESIDFGDVSVIELAPSGNVWVGSISKGCAAYTAATQAWSEFTVLNSSMKSDSVTAITLYAIGGVPFSFMGTHHGIGYKHGTTWDTIAGLVDPYVIDIVHSPTNHCLYVATKGGISVFNDTTLIHTADYTTANSMLPWGEITCFQSKQTSLTGFYYGTPDSGIYISNNGTNWGHISTDGGGIIDNRINCIHIDATGANQYYGTKGGFIYYNGSIHNYTTASGLAENDVTAIDVDCHSRIWAGTRNSGISIYNYQNNTWQHLTTAQGLPSNHITAINCKTSTCQTYVGTEDGGAIIIDSTNDVFQLPAAINNVEDESLNVRVFPQPANDLLTFTLQEEIENGEIVLYDINGKMVANQKIGERTSFSVDTRNLEQGLYFFSIKTENSVLRSGRVSILR